MTLFRSVAWNIEELVVGGLLSGNFCSVEFRPDVVCVCVCVCVCASCCGDYSWMSHVLHVECLTTHVHTLLCVLRYVEWLRQSQHGTIILSQNVLLQLIAAAITVADTLIKLRRVSDSVPRRLSVCPAPRRPDPTAVGLQRCPRGLASFTVHATAKLP